MEWNYREILERGSTELKEIVFIITQGNKPGETKEEKEYDKIEKS